MRKITSEMLGKRIVSRPTYERFMELFPGGCDVTYANMLKVEHAQFDVYWMAGCVFSHSVMDEYRSLKRKAADQYKKDASPFYKMYLGDLAAIDCTEFEQAIIDVTELHLVATKRYSAKYASDCAAAFVKCWVKENSHAPI